MTHDDNNKEAAVSTANRPQAWAQRVALAYRQNQEPKKPKLRYWRAPIFALFAAALAIIGVHFHSLGTPASESPRLALKTPPFIEAFATSPNVTVHLTLTVWGRQSSGDVSVTVRPPSTKPTGKILILSTVTPYNPEGAGLPIGSWQIASPTFGVGGAQARRGAARPTVYWFTVGIARIERAQDHCNNIFFSNIVASCQDGLPVADFNFPQVTQLSKGSFFARLPTLVGWGGLSGLLSFQGFPSFMAEVRHVHGKTVSDLTGDRTRSIFKRLVALKRKTTVRQALQKLIQNPSKYDARLGNAYYTLYWAPRVLTTEVLFGTQADLENARIDNISPSTWRFQEDSYIWQGGAGPLNPTISATENNAVEAQSNFNFVSGIFIATALAALLACIQEPLPGWRRKRKGQ